MNQNYIRFNNRIINICTLHNFIEIQKYDFGNYIIPKKGTKANKIKLFIVYNFTLHHIHDDNFKKEEYLEYEQKNQQSNTNKERKHNPPKRMSKIVSKAIKNYRSNQNKNNQNENILGNEWTDNGISVSAIAHNQALGGSGKNEIDHDPSDVKQDMDGNILDFNQHAQKEESPILEISNDNESEA